MTKLYRASAMNARAVPEIDTRQLAISAAVAVADAPFAELENQSLRLMEFVACGLLSKQAAVDIAYAAALGSGMVRTWGNNVVQEIIAAGFEGVA